MKKWLPALLIVAAVAVSIVLYPSLPEQVPTHFGMDGTPNGWSSRFWGAWLLPLIMAFVWVVMRAVPHIDPRKANYEKFMGFYELMVSAILAFMLAMHVAVLKSATGSHVPMDKFVIVGVGAFFMLLGFFMPRVHPNWFIGIRTPWTLTSDLSWERTHKIGGVLFVVLGLLAVLSALIAPTASIWVLVGGAVVMTIFLFAYSYSVWKNDPLKHSI